MEIEKLYGHEIEVGKTFNFDSGALHEPWIKNVVAIGLSANFVEPMEASSIGSSIQQSFLLMHMLSGYDEKTIQKYNKSINEMTDNIRDFIALHYITQKDHTQFWKDIQDTPLPDSLLEKLQWWHHHIPTPADFTHNTGYIMFSHMHHIHILHGLGLFNKDSFKMQWDGLSPNLQLQIEEQIKQLKMAKYQTISHKQAIGIIRNS
jgi:tryptophan halogenase